MNSVGIDISKGRSMVAVMRPFGEVVISSFEVHHTVSELSTLAKRLKSLNGETRVIMEATGNYHFHENHVFSLFVPFLPLTALGRFATSINCNLYVHHMLFDETDITSCLSYIERGPKS